MSPAKKPAKKKPPKKPPSMTNPEFLELLEKKMRNTRLRGGLKAVLREAFTADTKRELYTLGHYLGKDTKAELGVNVQDLYAYIQDPLVAQRDPAVGILPFEVRWEPGISAGPTSARFAVVDYNMDTASLVSPSPWNQDKRRFEDLEGNVLDTARKDTRQFHQVNVWAIAQTVLDFFENSLYGMGRPIPWGFEGNRLILVPHAGYGENAFYDRRSKSLQFYYFGDEKAPVFTCLSHDVVAHETGHALLDGIRPLYFEYSSVQTAGFHEFVGDLTALLLILRRNEVRNLIALDTDADLRKDVIIASLAEQFGVEINGSEALRNAHEKVTLNQILKAEGPHFASRALTTAMFEIMVRVANLYRTGATDDGQAKERTASQALAYTADRFPRLALRPIDLCPPMDINFLDYARAVLLNYDAHEPGTSKRLKTIGKILRDVFHEWKFCRRSRQEHKEGICDLEVEAPPRLNFRHNITDVARSRTAAYYYLNDNRSQLGIPPNHDIEVIDLYGLSKLGPAAVRLPREIVIEYLWREESELTGSQFGKLEGETVELLCGGTLVVDEHGNVISFFHKPGVDSPGEEDRAAGAERRRRLHEHILRQVKSGAVGLSGSSDVEAFGAWTPPVVADNSSGAVRLEITPHLRESFDPGGEDAEQPDPNELKLWNRGEDEWTTSF